VTGVEVRVGANNDRNGSWLKAKVLPDFVAESKPSWSASSYFRVCEERVD
jgi:hypothetical protein